jgi:hypothetical protein
MGLRLWMHAHGKKPLLLSRVFCLESAKLPDFPDPKKDKLWTKHPSLGIKLTRKLQV